VARLLAALPALPLGVAQLLLLLALLAQPLRPALLVHPLRRALLAQRVGALALPADAAV
jgi:hypothetical protein